MVRLSFIVPFYRVEEYIEECIRSLYAQDIPQEEYEVICVDDCSPDGSRAIVERLQKEYPTLRLLVHTKNKRQGGARNTGLRRAKGKYVWFVDSDDAIMSNCFKRLLEQAEQEELDVLQFDYTRDNGGTIIVSNNASIVQDGETYLFGEGTSQWCEKVSGPWLQILRRQFLVDEKIEFLEGAQYEDTDYMIHVFLKAQRVEHLPIQAYVYRENQASTTQVIASPQKLAWKINQLVRIGLLMDICRTEHAKEMIGDMLYKSFSALRHELERLNNSAKQIYRSNLLTSSIRRCKQCMNWRTWLAIRYGMTWFL